MTAPRRSPMRAPTCPPIGDDRLKVSGRRIMRNAMLAVVHPSTERM